MTGVSSAAFTLVLVLAVCSFAASQTTSTLTGNERCLNLTPSPRLELFVDPLPEMPIINLATTSTIVIGAFRILQRLHRDLPPTPMYGFGTSAQTAGYPGPTLVALQGRPARVRWENHIRDTQHLLPVDRSLTWANPASGFVPVVVHNHGAEVEGWSDGHPDAWFTAVGESGPTYVTQNYVYPNGQLPTMLWYHDHTIGITRLNMAAGLVGAYIIDPSSQMPVWVPRTYYVLVLQDKSFYSDGTIKYPDIGFNPPVHPQWCPAYLGDVVLVNGRAWPYLDIGPQMYRFRIVNAANSRFFVLTLNDTSLSFIKIGTDGGILATPIRQQQLTLGPSERADFLIDFSNCSIGSHVRMSNIGGVPFPNGPPANQSCMLFRVVHPRDSQPARIPRSRTPEQLASLTLVQLVRETAGWDLSGVNLQTIYNRPFLQSSQVDSGNGLVGLFLDRRLHFEDPRTELIQVYSQEVWVMINNIAFTHPMHIHLVNFAVIERQVFDRYRFGNGSCSFQYQYPDTRSCYSGYPERPDADQVGLKDTATVLPFYVTKFYVVFRSNLLASYRLNPTAYPGYVWHCHLPEHEDNDMMRPLQFSYTTTVRSNASFPA